jgi:TolB-like protein/Tfp pilus assembly protein PilF
MAAKSEAISGKRLDSWKEIAGFLGRAERTVKRWETERGLPVRRVPGGGRSAVFAYTDELADWLKGRLPELDGDDSANGQDLTPAPMQSQPTSTAAAPADRQGEKNWPRLAAWLGPLALAAIVIAVLTSSHRPTRFKSQSEPSNAQAGDLYLAPDSIAVLPFSNVLGGAGSDYLSDGITESLIGQLAHVPQLKVRSRDSVFRYKGKDTDLQTIGARLAVSVLVSGRVMLKGNTVEISTEITNVRENTEIWGQRYAGRTSDLVSLQQQMAGDIAGRLRSSLSTANKQEITRQGTQNAEAYALYLKGRYAWNKRTRTDLEAAVSYFNQAIAEDPEYTLAYSGLADVYAVMHFYAGNPREEFPKSNAAARKALELDPTLAHPHAVLASNEISYDWDLAAGENEYKKAIQLDPNDATAHQWYAESLSVLGGRQQEAQAEINHAHELDPFSPIISRVMASVRVAAGEYDEAISICKELASENPTFAVAHDCLFYGYWGKRMYPEAIEEWQIYAQLTGNPDDAESGAALQRGFRSGGWPGALTQVIAVLEARRKTSYSSPFMIARFYADLGDKDKAFDWLNIAYREHDCLLPELNTWFQFASLRADPRFAELVSRIGLPKS